MADYAKRSQESVSRQVIQRYLLTAPTLKEKCVMSKRQKKIRRRKVEDRPEGAGESRYARKVRMRTEFLNKSSNSWLLWVFKRRTGEITIK